MRRPPPEQGVPIADLLAQVEEASLTGWNKTDGGDLAYIPNGALYSGVLGALLAAGSHAFTGQAGEAPALVAIEESVHPLDGGPRRVAGRAPAASSCPVARSPTRPRS